MGSTERWCILELPCLIQFFFSSLRSYLLFIDGQGAGMLGNFRDEGQNCIEDEACVLKEARDPEIS